MGGQERALGSSRKGRKEFIDRTQVMGQPSITTGHEAQGHRPAWNKVNM